VVMLSVAVFIVMLAAVAPLFAFCCVLYVSPSLAIVMTQLIPNIARHFVSMPD
jgi:hypothetical protein